MYIFFGGVAELLFYDDYGIGWVAIGSILLYPVMLLMFPITIAVDKAIFTNDQKEAKKHKKVS